jgi:hypothetical protein
MTPRGMTTFLFVVAVAALSPGCVDPTHDDAVNALGPEDPNVPRGPNHRPGQPCLTCHGSEGPSHHEFSVGGTVYMVRGQPAPAMGATVQLEDINGSFANAQTNAVGNFYIPVQEWTPVYPIWPFQTTLGAASQQMSTHVGRDGSCADCHAEPASPTSAGQIYVMLPGGP